MTRANHHGSRFEVRDGRRSDVDALLRLVRRLGEFELPERRHKEDLYREDARLLSRWGNGGAEDALVHVAVDGMDAVVGFSLVRLRPEMLSGDPSAHLEALAVAAEAESQGVGHALLQAAEGAARAQGARTMTLHVFKTNRRALALYQRRGYDAEILRCIKPLGG